MSDPVYVNGYPYAVCVRLRMPAYMHTWTKMLTAPFTVRACVWVCEISRCVVWMHASFQNSYYGCRVCVYFFH